MTLVSGNMTVIYDDQAAEHLETGMYAYGPSKRPHTAYCEKGNPCVLFIAFEEPLDAFEIMKATKYPYTSDYTQVSKPCPKVSLNYLYFLMRLVCLFFKHCSSLIHNLN